MLKRLLRVILRRSPTIIIVIAMLASVGYLNATRSGNVVPHVTKINKLPTLGLPKSPSKHNANVGKTSNISPVPTNNYGFSADELVGMDATKQSMELDGIKATGVSWVRIDMEWYVVQPVDASTYDWSVYDQVINALDQHGLKALVILDYAPAWAAAYGCTHSLYHKCSPVDPAAFATYAAAAAARYTSRGVTDWEIWNEPNTAKFWYPSANAANYAALLQATYPAINQVNPNATVITGGLSSVAAAGTIDPPEYVSDLYAAGAQPYFDAIGAHPYSYPLLPSVAAAWSGWTQMLEIRNIAVSHGDAAKMIWITEVGASTGGPHPVSENFQSQLVDQAISLRNSYTWAGPLFWYDYQNLGTNPYTSEDSFGLVRTDGSQKPAYANFVQAIK